MAGLYILYCGMALSRISRTFDKLAVNSTSGGVALE